MNRKEYDRKRAVKRWNDFKMSLGYDTAIKRKADYISGESYCAGCMMSIPKTLWCPKCGKRMRINPKYNKGKVHRY